MRIPKESEKSIVELIKEEANPKISLTPSKIALKTSSSVYLYRPTGPEDYKKILTEIADVLIEKRGITPKPEVKEEVKVEEKIEKEKVEEEVEKKPHRKPVKKTFKRKELES